MHKILVGYDFSEMADGALALAADRARSNGAIIKVLHVAVIPSGVKSTTGAMAYPSQAELDRLRADLQAAVSKRAVAATIDVVVGTNAGSEILIAAREFGADEIVIGTRGRGGVRRALLGSVADYVVRNATCPVTTIRRGTSFAAASAP